MKIGTSTVTAIYLGTTSIVSAYLGSTQVFGGTSAFTPLDLFSTGSQGIWLDPSDLSTMFSDRAGTTPVTAPGTVVGLRLDKSKGLALGAELVGTFAAYANATFSTVGGVTTVTCSANGSYGITLGFSGAAGKTYAMTFEVLSNSASRVLYGWTSLSSSINLNAGTTTGIKSGSVLASANGSGVIAILGATAGETFSIRNISVRELAGNHAVAPTDAARPVYGVEPKGGRRNLFLQTEDFSNAAWSKIGSPTLTNQGGGVWRLQASAASTWFLTQNTTLDTTGVVTVDVKSNGGGLDIFRFTVDGGVSSDLTAASDWTRLSFSRSHTGTGPTGITRDAANSAVDILIRFPQFETGSTATNYQRVLSAYDITESGVATCHYVQYDGSDDSMSTAAIDFTAADKMSVFAGVRKLSDAARGVVAELSSVVTNPGAFVIYAPSGTATPAYLFSAGGTFTTIATSPSSYPAPITNVMMGIGDIGGDNTALRIDGTQVAQSSNNQGTGNFGNYPLFIGRRNNATLPFNGRDFGIIIVGKAASAGEITDTETWLAAKTAQVTL